MTNSVSKRGFAAVSELLATRGLRHAVVEHPQTFTAAAEARIAAVAPDHAAKTVMARDDDGYVLTVLPASCRLDLRKLRRLASRPHLGLATEQELALHFPEFEVGALPPFGELFDCPQFMDRRLFAGSRILCNGGDHRHSIVLEAGELGYASGAQVGDLSSREDDE